MTPLEPAMSLTWPTLLAHAFGQRFDLPIPLALFVLGGGTVVLASFLIVDRLSGTTGVVVPRAPLAPSSRPSSRFGAIVGTVLLAVLVACGIGGSQAVAENIVPTTFWLLIWIAVPLSCALLGDWSPLINPIAAVARWSDRDGWRAALIGRGTLLWPEWLAWWPAVALFFFVACGELIYNHVATVPSVTASGLAVYWILSGLAGLLFGAEAWLSRGELFSVLFDTWGRLGWWRFGRPGRRGFLGGLTAPVDPSVSRLTFILMMLMAVTFDGLLATPSVKRAIATLPAAAAPGTAAYIAIAIVAFAGLVGIAWIFFGSCAQLVRRAMGDQSSITRQLALLAPSLLPIAFGYLLAHNLDYLAVNGQLLIPLLGNPSGTHQWLPSPFNDTYEIHKHVLPPSVIWYVAVTVIILVHIAAVVVANRQLSVNLGGRQGARRAELWWTAAMILYTMTSLWLLAQPIAKEAGHSASQMSPRVTQSRALPSSQAPSDRVDPLRL